MPSIRGELWEDDISKRDRRHAIYAVLAVSLRTLDILIHPFCPYTSEYLYGVAFGRKESVLLESWPVPDDTLVQPDIEEAFDSSRVLLSVAAAARAKARLKRRWPLKEAYCMIPPGREGVERFWDTLQIQMNVQTLHPPVVCRSTEGLEQYLEMREAGMPVIPSIGLERGRLGPRVKGMMGGLLKAFGDTDPHMIIESLKDGSRTFKVGDSHITLEREDFAIGYEPAEGYQAASKDGYVVFVSTSSDEETRAAWMLRDVARRLQNMRREMGHNPTDILDSATVLGLDDMARNMVESGTFDLAGLVRVRRIVLVESEHTGPPLREENIDGQTIRISIG